MPGLDPVIHGVAVPLDLRREPLLRAGWVYIMTNQANGTLYTGVTSNLARRVWEHRDGVIDGFTKQTGLKRLVFAEPHEDIRAAIGREKAIKSWRRAWKVRLILDANPSWADLYDLLALG